VPKIKKKKVEEAGADRLLSPGKELRGASIPTLALIHENQLNTCKSPVLVNICVPPKAQFHIKKAFCNMSLQNGFCFPFLGK